jgi:hypothetical protein
MRQPTQNVDGEEGLIRLGAQLRRYCVAEDVNFLFLQSQDVGSRIFCETGHEPRAAFLSIAQRGRLASLSMNTIAKIRI